MSLFKKIALDLAINSIKEIVKNTPPKELYEMVVPEQTRGKINKKVQQTVEKGRALAGQFMKAVQGGDAQPTETELKAEADAGVEQLPATLVVDEKKSAAKKTARKKPVNHKKAAK